MRATMTRAQIDSLVEFRLQIYTWLFITTLFLATILKYANVLIGYFFGADNTLPEEISGMWLTRLNPISNWEPLLRIGMWASLSALAVVLLIVFVRDFRVKVFASRGSTSNQYRLETVTILALLGATSAIGSLGVTASSTIAYLNFAPLTFFVILNPAWGHRLYAPRLLLALTISAMSFLISGSKLVLLFLFCALIIDFLYRGLSRFRMVIIVIVVLLSVLLYPYLNIFRSDNSSSAKEVLIFILSKLNNEFSASGIWQLFLNSYDAILGRLVGLDGLMLANSLKDIPRIKDISVGSYLTGNTGIGISVGMLGQLLLHLGDLLIAVLLYLLIIPLSWYVVAFLDKQFCSLGFTSIGNFMYIKAIIVLNGGFRIADIKVTLFTIIALLVVAIISSIYRKPSGSHYSRRLSSEQA